MILDTSVVIGKLKRRKEIRENITELTVIEYPPRLNYKKFGGKIYTITEEAKALAIELQIKLRNVGKQKPAIDVLIAAICINRNETLITNDRDFLDIVEVDSRFRVKVIDKEN